MTKEVIVSTIKQFRDPYLCTDGSAVGFYEREFYPFSNFSSFQVKWQDQTWMTSEHAYQAIKFSETAPDLYKRISLAKSAHEAYKIAKVNTDKLPNDWNERKAGVMFEIVRAKCQQHTYIQEKLLQTDSELIVEDSPMDSFWGWGSNRQGRNELGKIWMKLREELRHGQL